MANQKWKRSEREFATRLQAAAGRVVETVHLSLVTVTGRVGHLTELGFDILVGREHTAICGEAKRRKTFLGAEALRALLQIIGIAHEWGRKPVMGFTLADDVPAFIPTKKGKLRIERNYVVLPLSFAEELMYAMRYLDDTGMYHDFVDWMAYEKEQAADPRAEEDPDEIAA